MNAKLLDQCNDQEWCYVGNLNEGGSQTQPPTTYWGAAGAVCCYLQSVSACVPMTQKRGHWRMLC